jgi:hypothetical protein
MDSLKSINNTLQLKLSNLYLKLEQIQHSNTISNKNFNRDIFFSGAITLLVGGFFGFFLSRNKQHRKRW